MADRQGGKQSPGDAGTKQDQPSDQAGAEKAAVEAADAKAAEGQEKAAEAAEAKPKPKRAPRKKAAPKAEDTAAEETGVEKDAAEAATEEKPKARSRGSRGGRGRGAKEPAAEVETAKPEKPAPRRRRDEEALTGARPVVRAQAKYVRTSARKARLVCDHIRGKSVDEARAILAFTPRAVARDWSKLLESAVANAEHNHELVGDDLRVLAAFADEGPTLKRFRPRAMGRATRIRKRTSHLTIQLTPKE
jgi:ribosomal protein L22